MGHWFESSTAHQNQMLLAEAYKKLALLKGKKVHSLYDKMSTNITEFKINKGGLGMLILNYLGLPLDSKLTDFVDGELKTTKTNSEGKPLEPIAITMINRIIDELISDKPKDFYKSNLFKKIQNIVILGVCKDNKNHKEWIFTFCYHFSYKKNKKLYLKFEKDYYSICNQLKYHLKKSYPNDYIGKKHTDGLIHTSNGELIQIRTKANKPYTPIISKLWKREISNKNHAFYFLRRMFEKNKLDILLK